MSDSTSESASPWEVAVRGKRAADLSALLLSAIGQAPVTEAVELAEAVVKHLRAEVVKQNLQQQDQRLGALSGTELIELRALSFLQPRGKFNATFYESDLVLASASGKEENAVSINIPLKAIKNYLFIPKKDTRHKAVVSWLCVLHLEQAIAVRKSSLSYIVFQVEEGGETHTWNFKTGNTLNLPAKLVATQRSIVDTLLQAIAAKHKHQTFIEVPANPNKANQATFRSAASGEPFVRCFYKTADGELYLLPQGLFFMRPFLFVPVAEIASLQSSRSGSARTFDLLIEVSDGSKVDFSMIDRNENGPIAAFIDNLRKLQKKRQLNSKQQPEDHEQDGEGDDSSSSDQDYDPSASDVEKEKGVKAGGDDEEDKEDDGSEDGDSDDSDDDSDATDASSEAETEDDIASGDEAVSSSNIVADSRVRTRSGKLLHAPESSPTASGSSTSSSPVATEVSKFRAKREASSPSTSETDAGQDSGGGTVSSFFVKRQRQE